MARGRGWITRLGGVLHFRESTQGVNGERTRNEGVKPVDRGDQLRHHDTVRKNRSAQATSVRGGKSKAQPQAPRRTGGVFVSGGKAKPKKYKLRALGHCLEATAHRLNKSEVARIEQWCENEGCGSDEILGNLEETLEGYNCYSTNLWQSGIVPVVDSVKLVLLDDAENEIITIAKPRGLIKRTNPARSLTLTHKEGNVLVYFEEYKGLVATWVFETEGVPEVSDLSIDTDKIAIGGNETEFIDAVRFRGEELERDYDEEDVRGKAAYSLLF